ncbi:hypothetical protein M3Y96_01152000 [Aphelenchoides besseyi]|nr:hypothetical protein M3Y96_01152000 [Aphelenchoides besseyi]
MLLTLGLKEVGIWSHILQLISFAFDPRINAAVSSVNLNPNHEFPLLNVLRSCSLNTNTTAKIESILVDGNYSNDLKITFVYNEFVMLFGNGTQNHKCIFAAIERGFTLSDFMEIGRLYKQTSELSILFGGERPLIVDQLTDLLLEMANTTTKLDEIKALETIVNELCLYFENQTSVGNVEIGEWGQLKDMLKVHTFYSFHGWHWIHIGNREANCSTPIEMGTLQDPAKCTSIMET